MTWSTEVPDLISVSIWENVSLCWWNVPEMSMQSSLHVEDRWCSLFGEGWLSFRMRNYWAGPSNCPYPRAGHVLGEEWQGPEPMGQLCASDPVFIFKTAAVSCLWQSMAIHPNNPEILLATSVFLWRYHSFCLVIHTLLNGELRADGSRRLERWVWRYKRNMSRPDWMGYGQPDLRGATLFWAGSCS